MKYLLTVIDIFSRYGWIVPLKNKTGLEVANALKKIFKERKPDKLWVDKGKEFYNSHVQKLITLYSTENEEKSSMVERWNRTMKEKMFKYFSANSTRKYIDILDKLVDQCNNKIHSSTGMSPKEVNETKNETTVWRKLYDDYVPAKRNSKSQIKSELPGRKEFSKKAILRDGQKKFLQFQKFDIQTR